MHRVVVVVSYGRSTTPTHLPQHRLHHCCHYSTCHFGCTEGKVADPTAHCVLLCPWWHCIRVRLGGKNQVERLFYAVSLAPQCLPILSSYRSDVRSNPRTLLGPRKRQFTQYNTNTGRCWPPSESLRPFCDTQCDDDCDYPDSAFDSTSGSTSSTYQQHTLAGAS